MSLSNFLCLTAKSPLLSWNRLLTEKSRRAPISRLFGLVNLPLMSRVLITRTMAEQGDYGLERFLNMTEETLAMKSELLNPSAPKNPCLDLD